MTLIELLAVLFPIAGLWAGIAIGGRHGFLGGVVGGLCGAVAGVVAYVLFMVCVMALIKLTAFLPGNRTPADNDELDALGAVWPPPPQVPDDKGHV